MPGDVKGMRKKASAETPQSIEFTGTMNAHAAEALRLEIRRLAKSHGVEVQDLRVEKVGTSAAKAGENTGD